MAKTKKGKSAMSQIAEFHAAVIRHLPEIDTMGKQRWIDDPEGLKKFLSGLVPSQEIENPRPLTPHATLIRYAVEEICDFGSLPGRRF